MTGRISYRLIRALSVGPITWPTVTPAAPGPALDAGAKRHERGAVDRPVAEGVAPEDDVRALAGDAGGFYYSNFPGMATCPRWRRRSGGARAVSAAAI